ncbi:hypothetical protein, partial [Bacteroides ovatus]|uniref:hypothetical protein n=1 Tax=Bacteroides ovatus TaxID=28116 RepID=UPI0022E76B9A
KTYYFFLPSENKILTKAASLTGNDLETSELLHSAMFCTSQKNDLLCAKVQNKFDIHVRLPLIKQHFQICCYIYGYEFVLFL